MRQESSDHCNGACCDVMIQRVVLLFCSLGILMGTCTEATLQHGNSKEHILGCIHNCVKGFRVLQANGF